MWKYILLVLLIPNQENSSTRTMTNSGYYLISVHVFPNVSSLDLDQDILWRQVYFLSMFFVIKYFNNTIEIFCIYLYNIFVSSYFVRRYVTLTLWSVILIDKFSRFSPTGALFSPRFQSHGSHDVNNRNQPIRASLTKTTWSASADIRFRSSRHMLWDWIGLLKLFVELLCATEHWMNVILWNQKCVWEV